MIYGNGISLMEYGIPPTILEKLKKAKTTMDPVVADLPQNKEFLGSNPDPKKSKGACFGHLGEDEAIVRRVVVDRLVEYLLPIP